jgi:pimeloyl-ACP methyl ester carboxylesterase
VDPVEGKPGAPQSWNRFAYVRGNPVRSVDPDGLLTIIIPGTFSGDAEWAQSGQPFNVAVSRTFGEKAVVLDWSHRNSESARTEAAHLLKSMIAKHEFAEDEKLNIVAHSHGGNVAFEAIVNGGVGRRVDTLVTLGTPVRPDYGIVHNPDLIGQDINVYSEGDDVQNIGGETRGIELGSAGRTRNGAQNIEVPDASHEDLHSAKIWDEYVYPALGGDR